MIIQNCPSRWLSLLIFLTLSIFGYSQQHEFFKVLPEQGLSHSTIRSITKDKDGFVWIATLEGIDKFNGTTIKTYPRNELGVDCTVIRSLLVTVDDLYAGYNNGVLKYNIELDKFVPIESKDYVVGTVNNLYYGSNELVYICSQKGLFSVDSDNFFNKIVQNENIRAICEYKTNIFFIATNDNILLINSFGEIIKEYDYPEKPDAPSRKGAYGRPTLFKGSDSNIWLGTLQGLFKYNFNEDIFQYVEFIGGNERIESFAIRAINEDNYDNLWIGTENGLFVYGKSTGEIIHYGQSFQNNPYTLSDRSIHSLFIDDNDTFWIGTYFGGVNYTKSNQIGFQNLTPNDFFPSINGKAISDLIEVGKEDIWIATEDGGITIFNREKKTFEYLIHDDENKNTISSNNIHALFEDNRNNIWIGTFLGGLNKYNISSKEIKLYKNEEDNESSISNDHIYSLLQLDNENLLVGTQFGLNVYNYDLDSFSLYKPEYFQDKFIHDMLIDIRGDLWICTSENGIFKVAIEKDEVINYSQTTEMNSISENEINAIYEDSLGNLWFCTYNDGLIKWDSELEKFSTIKKADGLSNNTIYGILEATGKGYYISTNSGLNFYSPELSDIKHYDEAAGISSEQFNYKAYLKDSDGWLYFGSLNGLTYFHPDSLKVFKKNNNIRFSSLKVFNKEVEIGKESILHKHIDKIDTLHLKHNQNAITIEYVQLDYSNNSKNQYSYFLEGYETDWQNVENNTSATYTNLPPGNYKFHVKLTEDKENDGLSRLLVITISPPFWQTDWAYFLYTVFFLLIAFSTFKLISFIQQKNVAIQLERVQKEKIEELNQHKLNFFTFISHEFKTPLTLIIAAVDKLNRTSFSEDSNNLVSIKKSARKLHHLVQQLLTFRKIETDHAKMNLSSGDIVLFIRDTFSTFSPLFKVKQHKALIETNTESFNCYFDAEKIETILSNLISNAIKYTKPFGKITLTLKITEPTKSQKNSFIKISISDTGSGIKKETQENMYIPHFTTEKASKYASGIGLALVKSLVDLLNGKISYSSTVGKGTSFNIELPLAFEAPKNAQTNVIYGNKKMELPTDLIIEKEEQIEAKSINKNGDFTILLVEDNKELINFLYKHFSKSYKVIKAFDGNDALSKIEKSAPDIIISDLKMPNMDGLSLCKILKKSEKTKHIPFILLTGQSYNKQKIESLELGVSAFITKPFNLKELSFTVKNFIDSSKNVQHHFSSLFEKSNHDIPDNNRDKEFLLQVTNLIEANYLDPTFSIQTLSEMAGISRSLLHVKMKKIVGISTSHYILKIRMQKSAQLLREGYSSSEVAYKLGYEPSYFSRVFKKYFEVSPSEYASTFKTETQKAGTS